MPVLNFLKHNAESYFTRALTPFFYTRVALMVLYLLLLTIPSWQNIVPINAKYSLPVFYFVLLYTLASYVLAEHKRYGRLIMFWTMNCVIFWWYCRWLLKPLDSPAPSCAQLLNTTFFALLFPSPVRVICTHAHASGRNLGNTSKWPPPHLGELSLLLMWHALVNDGHLHRYLLSSREEAQRQAILHLENELAALARAEGRVAVSREIFMMGLVAHCRLDYPSRIFTHSNEIR